MNGRSERGPEDDAVGATDNPGLSVSGGDSRTDKRCLSVAPVPATRLSLLFVCALFLCACTQEGAVPSKYRRAVEAGTKKSKVAWKIDFHAHVATMSFERAQRIMDRNGIALAVNLTPGFPGGGLETALMMSHLTGDRIVNFVNIDWEDVGDPARFAETNVRHLKRAKAMGARGLKISKALGLGIPAAGIEAAMKEHTSASELLRVDDPRLDPIWEEAGRQGLPVSIHTADPVVFFHAVTPSNERYRELSVHPHWSFFGPQWPKFEDLIGQLRKVVASHPATLFVGVHFGNFAENPSFVGKMLDEFPNYHIDVAARVPEFGRHDAGKMRDFFVKYQDRVLFGTDLGVGRSLMLGSGGDTEPTEDDAEKFYDAHWRYFETGDRRIDHPTPIQGDWKIDAIDLPVPVLEKLYYKNAEKLLGVRLNPVDLAPH
ncbi:MAG: amidohydrolase family protein [Deltaproteobacteria bacterium]|nr:amidohydrolase family protein [Deltaproteobacteria bacterium]